MSLPRRARARKAPDLTELQWAFLNDALDGDDPRCREPEYKWRIYELHANRTLGDNRPIGDDLWRTYGSNVVQRWVVEKPGTRPTLWWVYAAPRVTRGTFKTFGGDALPEPRRRLGGIGTPVHECLAYVPEFRLGVPCRWISHREVDLYTGKTTDVRGRPIMQEARGKSFRGMPIDPDNPPLYEAQAAYLERHELLLPGERERLTGVDFEPEAVACSEEEDG
jgi:hypothetical protein